MVNGWNVASFGLVTVRSWTKSVADRAKDRYDMLSAVGWYVVGVPLKHRLGSDSVFVVDAMD